MRADPPSVRAGTARKSPEFPCARARRRRRPTRLGGALAKDTEKLIRQLSLISYLMAERRPVTATEIRRDVEGYSGHERGRLRAPLLRRPRRARVARDPAHGRQAGRRLRRAGELLAARPRTSTCRRSRSPTRSSRRCRPRCRLLDGEFAYAEPLRLALQQIIMGPPEPADAPEQRSVGLGLTAGPAATSSPSAWRRSRRRSSAARRSSSTTTRCSATRPSPARSTPTCCSSRAASSTSSATRTSATRSASSASRASAARSPTRRRPSTTSSAPTDFDPRELRQPDRLAARRHRRHRRDLGLRAHRLAGRAPLRRLRRARRAEDGGASSAPSTRCRACSSPGSLGLGEHARVLGPARARRPRRASALDAARRAPPRRADRGRGRPRARRAEPEREAEPTRAAAARRRDPPRALRAARHARLHPHRRRPRRPPAAGRRGAASSLQISEAELREDIWCSTSSTSAAGSYVLYAELRPTATIEVDPEPYSDTFARPARLLPVEAKALVAAIDLIGEHVPAGSLDSAREKIVAALGEDPRARACRSPPPRATTPRSRASSPRAIAAAAARGARVLQAATRTSSPSRASSRTR